MKKISIVLATYNGIEFIKEQIDSILNQTISPFEIIICDDLSTDGTRKYLCELSYRQKIVVRCIMKLNS